MGRRDEGSHWLGAESLHNGDVWYLRVLGFSHCSANALDLASSGKHEWQLITSLCWTSFFFVILCIHYNIPLMWNEMKAINVNEMQAVKLYLLLFCKDIIIVFIYLFDLCEEFSTMLCVPHTHCYLWVAIFLNIGHQLFFLYCNT